MMYLIYSLLLGAFSPTVLEKSYGPPVTGDSLSVQVLNYDQLKPLLHNVSDTTYVVNFWATWCAPCVQELPFFLALDSMYRDQPFKLILVSLDFKKDYLRKLEPFVKERKIEEYVVVLEDNRANYWIDDIDPSWSGAIPATLVYRADRRVFLERTFHHVNELSDIVKPFLNL
jgi:thiol-disulfide isomerase/thioredoxin